MTGARRVCFPFLGRTIGGSQHSTLLLARHLDPARYAPLVVLHEEGPLAPLVKRYGLEYELLPLPFLFPQPFAAVPAAGFLPHRWGDLRRSIRTIRDFAAARAVDVIHIDDGTLRYLWQPARHGRKYVHCQRTRLPGFSLEKTLRLPALDLVLCNADFTRGSMPFTVRGRAQVLYPPVDPGFEIPAREICRRALRAEHGLPEDAALIGFLANFQRRKRPGLVPEIARILRDGGLENFAFVMAGNRYDDTAGIVQEKIRAYGLEKQVIVTGFCNDPLSFLAGCDLMIAPAADEAFGRTLIEAMLAGTPVIAADAGGHREIVRSGSNGFLVPPDDAAAFAAQIGFCLARPDLCAGIARQAAQVAREKYDARTLALELMDLYDGMYDGRC